MDNLYVQAIEAQDLTGSDDARRWDAVDLLVAEPGAREGRVAWHWRQPATCYGFAMWWECDLLPGITLSTSPWSTRTHWDQLYLPVLAPLSLRTGDRLVLSLACATDPAAGAEFRWSIEQLREGKPVAAEDRNIADGFLG